MCFFNSMSKKAHELAERYGKILSISAAEVDQSKMDKNYCIAAFIHPHTPIITAADEIQDFTWGLIPHFIHAKGDSTEAVGRAVENARDISNKTINARAETIFEKPSYRKPILHNRCIIPSTGFFEYHTNDNGTKQPYFVFLEDEEIFSIAGIYDEWYNPQTKQVESTYSMITTEANRLMYWIHNGGNNPHRMPVIIAREDEEIWLDPHTPVEELKRIMQPFDDKRMNAYKVRKDFRTKATRNPRDPSIQDEAE